MDGKLILFTVEKPRSSIKSRMDDAPLEQFSGGLWTSVRRIYLHKSLWDISFVQKQYIVYSVFILLRKVINLSMEVIWIHSSSYLNNAVASLLN